MKQKKWAKALAVLVIMTLFFWRFDFKRSDATVDDDGMAPRALGAAIRARPKQQRYLVRWGESDGQKPDNSSVGWSYLSYDRAAKTLEVTHHHHHAGWALRAHWPFVIQQSEIFANGCSRDLHCSVADADSILSSADTSGCDSLFSSLGCQVGCSLTL